MIKTLGLDSMTFMSWKKGSGTAAGSEVLIAGSQVPCIFTVALDPNCNRVRRYTQLYK